MKYETKDERLSRVYRSVEAMYRKGYSVKDISRNLKLSMMDTYDICQKIFALDQIRADRA